MRTCPNEDVPTIVRSTESSIPEVTHPTAEHYRLGVEAAPTGLVMVDARGTIILVNQQIEAMFGYDRSELLGESVGVLLPKRYRAHHSQQMLTYLAAPSTRTMGQGRDLFGVRKDGTEFAVEIGLNSSGTGPQPIVLASIVDVTQRKAQEAELQSRLQTLLRYQTEMGLLNEMSSLLQHAIVHSEAYAIVSVFGRKLLPCPEIATSVALYTTRESPDTLERRAYWGEATEERFQKNACWALRRSQPHYVPAASDDLTLPRCAHAPATGWHFCVPMAAHGNTVGVVVLNGEGALPSERQADSARTARAIADQLGLAISSIDLQQSLRDLAIRDPLTGLFNRRHLEEAASREMARVKRIRSHLSVLMVDIDHFKKLNDTHGHQTGDQVLARVGQTLRERFLESDIVCRYGGEEFLVMLPDCEKAVAVRKARTLCEALHTTEFGVTVSIGVAEFPSDGQSWELVVRTADAALYEAKRGGRNRVHPTGSQAPADSI